MSENLADWITAIGTVAIPVVLFFAARRYNLRRETIDLENRTLNQLSELNKLVANAVKEKNILDSRYNIDDNKRFSYKYISENKNTEHFVFLILNEYNSMCLGCNEGLFSDDIFLKLRGSAFRTTMKQYNDYIATYRKAVDKPDAWIQCDKFLERTGGRV